VDDICPEENIFYLWTNFDQMANVKIFTTFGERLRILREDSGQTLREVAANMGIDPSLLAKIERNERQATKEQIKLIAEYFKVNEKQLVKEFLSDQFAYRMIEEEADLDTLRVAEAKVTYYKTKTKK
jgi:transcriptional regulator with XRE-family HTH domain